MEKAPDDARQLAGDRHFAGALRHSDENTVERFLARAPQALLTRLEGMHPGVYKISDNEAPRSLTAVLDFMDTFALEAPAWKAQGIDVAQYEPTHNGYLEVGVLTELATAQTKFDAAYGNMIRVTEGLVFRSLAGPRGRGGGAR